MNKHFRTSLVLVSLFSYTAYTLCMNSHSDQRGSSSTPLNQQRTGPEVDRTSTPPISTSTASTSSTKQKNQAPAGWNWKTIGKWVGGTAIAVTILILLGSGGSSSKRCSG